MVSYSVYNIYFNYIWHPCEILLRIINVVIKGLKPITKPGRAAYPDTKAGNKKIIGNKRRNYPCKDGSQILILRQRRGKLCNVKKTVSHIF